MLVDFCQLLRDIERSDYCRHPEELNFIINFVVEHEPTGIDGLFFMTLYKAISNCLRTKFKE